MTVLTAIDLLGIQSFVFASNRLRDVVGSSALVAQAGDIDGLLKAIGIDADEVVMAAGGNVVLRLTDMARAKEIAGSFSRRLIDDVPGLEAVVVHHEQSGGLASSLAKLFARVAEVKQGRLPSVPTRGLGVSAICSATSLPANVVDRNDGPVSDRIRLARGERGDALKTWQRQLSTRKSPDGHRLRHPLEFDRLGRTRGDTSLIGIVHIDGNSVGRKIVAWLKALKDASDERVMQEYRQLSSALDALGSAGFESARDRVCDALALDTQGRVYLAGTPEELSFPLFTEEGTTYIPLVPVLLGGDDLTFVCDGRIALSLAEAALSAFQSAEPIPGLGRIGACAGVAIVHAHAPFFRAYELAEELCRSAKTLVRDEECAFALDWQIGLGSPGVSLAERRAKEYQVRGPERSADLEGVLYLTSRPYRLEAGDESWEWLSQSVLKRFRESPWSERRNKVQSLRSVARAGPDALARQIGAWRVVRRSSEERLEFPGGISDGGFSNGHTALVDAVELLDVHFAPRKPADEAAS
jgi:hypothetical protein